VRFTTLHALRRSARAPCRRFSLPHGAFRTRLIIERPTSDVSVASRVCSPRLRTMNTHSAEIAFPALPVKRERLARPEMSSIEDDAGRPATQPFRATPVFRESDLAVLPPRFAFRRHFARRGLPLWASPRSFELIPVREWRARPSLGTTSSFDFCNTTRSADTPRDSFVPCACAGQSQTRSPRSPPPTFLGKAGAVFPRMRAAPPSPCENGPLRDCPCGLRRPRAPSPRFVSSRRMSRAPARRVSSTPWSPMRACGHWGARRCASAGGPS
jgi:hypothetical protein